MEDILSTWISLLWVEEDAFGRLVDGRGPKLPDEEDAVGRLNDGLGNLAPLLELLADGAGFP